MNCHRYAFQVRPHWTSTCRKSKKLPNVGFGGIGLYKSCDVGEFEGLFGKSPTLNLNRKHHSSFKPEAEIYIMLLFVLFTLAFCPANIFAKRKLPQIPLLTHSTLLIANLRLPSSVEILEGLQLHACKLSSFGHCHAIFTERSNGIANQHCIPSCLFRSRDERVERCFNTGCGTMESPWLHEVQGQVAASLSRSRLLLRTLLLLLRRLRLRQRL